MRFNLLNLIIIGLFISLSCNNKNILNPEEMKLILYQIHECEAYNELRYSNSNMEFLEACKSSVLKEHKITNDKYMKSIAYYKKNFEEFGTMYDTLYHQQERSEVKK